MARVARLQGGAEPRAAVRVEGGEDRAEVRLVPRPPVFRLVEERDLGREVGDALGGPEPEFRERLRHRQIAAEPPRVRPCFVEEDFEFWRLGSLSFRVEFVDRRREPLAPPPLAVARNDLRDRPPGELPPNGALVAPEDRDLHVFVVPRLAVEEEVEGPAARDEPRSVEALHDGGDLMDGREGHRAAKSAAGMNPSVTTRSAAPPRPAAPSVARPPPASRFAARADARSPPA